MKRFNVRKIVGNPLAARLIYRVVNLYGYTFRLKIENEAPWLNHLNNGGKVLLCAWHQQFFSAMGYFKKYRGYDPCIMISPSKDGEIVANVAKQAGWHSIRGSSSRDGKKALRNLISKLKETKLAAHIVDGPRGPIGNVKAGAIRLAHMTGAVVVPFYVWPERSWTFNSWDRFFIPKPSATVLLRFGEMITFEPAGNKTDFESQRKYLEKIMRPGLKK
jgi:lysophospholipid acyltransferase (LPLAT)-like uncharacterized protein